MIVWSGPKKLRVVAAPMRATSPARKRGEDFVEDAERLLPAVPLRLGAEQIFLRHHLEDRPDVLRHAAVDEDEAESCKLCARASARLRRVENT